MRDKAERIPQVLTPSQLAFVLYSKFAEILNGNTDASNFEKLPICRSDYYRLKNGNMGLSLKKIMRVCEYLGLPNPKIYL